MPKLEIGTQNPIQLYYEDHGEGSPVVLIHGWPLSGRAWEAQIAPLVAAGHRVVTYDRRGFGQTSQPWDGYDYDTFADDLEWLMGHLELEDAALVGFSMGGGEVVRYLSRHSSRRVKKAVLLNAVTPYLLKTDDNPEGGLDEPTILSMQGAIAKDRLAFLDGFLTNFFGVGGKLMISEAQRQYALQIAAFASVRGTSACIDAWGRTDFRPDLARVDVPTLVVHSDSDAIVPIEISGRRAARDIAGAKLVVVKGAPHGFTTSHADLVNQHLIEFLAD